MHIKIKIWFYNEAVIWPQDDRFVTSRPVDANGALISHVDSYEGCVGAMPLFGTFATVDEVDGSV